MRTDAPQLTRVTWLHDGKELVTSDRYEIIYEEEMGTVQLIVRDVSPTDSGEYTCVATAEVVEPLTGRRLSKTIKSIAQVMIEGEWKLFI